MLAGIAREHDIVRRGLKLTLEANEGEGGRIVTFLAHSRFCSSTHCRVSVVECTTGYSNSFPLANTSMSRAGVSGPPKDNMDGILGKVGLDRLLSRSLKPFAVVAFVCPHAWLRDLLLTNGSHPNRVRPEYEDFEGPDRWLAAVLDLLDAGLPDRAVVYA